MTVDVPEGMSGRCVNEYAARTSSSPTLPL